MDTYAPIILTGILTMLASSGFWTYKIRKLERKYQQQDKHEEVLQKLDTLLTIQGQQSSQLAALQEHCRKTNAVTMAVARDRIYHLCNRAIKEKNLDPDNMRDIRSLLEPYTANGGNGLADEYYAKYEHMYKTHGGAV